MKKITLLFALSTVLLTSCERLDMKGMFSGTSPRNDQRFADSEEYNQKNGYQTITTTSDDYRVYFATDFHVDSTTLHTQQWVDSVLNDPTCEVAIALGDMVNGREKYSYFDEAIKPLYDASFPFFATAGNHDIYFSEWPNFLKYFHTSHYYFTVQTPNHTDFYICLDTSDGTVGVDQMAWFKKVMAEQAGKDHRHTIIYTHTHMFKPDGAQGHTSNFPLEETYELLSLFGEYEIDWYVCGHRHYRDIETFKGVTYIQVDAIQESYEAEDAYYMIANISSDLSYTFVPLAEPTLE